MKEIIVRLSPLDFGRLLTSLEEHVEKQHLGGISCTWETVIEAMKRGLAEAECEERAGD